MRKYLITLVLCFIFITDSNSLTAATIKIASSLPDFASIASYIGGDKVETFSIARAQSNPHFVEVLPSYMIRVAKADIYLKVGLSLDKWADSIIQGSRNNSLTIVDCSTNISVLGKPAKADAIMGDVHPDGNPHYWLNPENGIVIAKNILKSLTEYDPQNSDYYHANYNKFKKETEMDMIAWKEKMSKIEVRKIIGYHSSWIYFASAFTLAVAGHVEPYPGIPPTGKHLSELITVIRENKVGILMQEVYFPDKAPKFLQRQTGIKVFKEMPSCTGTGEKDYLNHFEDIINDLTS